MRFRKSALSAIIVLVALATIVILSGLNFIVPNVGEVEPPKVENMKKIFLTAKDDVKIAADYRNADVSQYQQPLGWAVLIHMMPATKESWKDLAAELQKADYESIAIDLRGHGESDAGPDGFTKFSDAEHQKSVLDLEAAADYLTKEGHATSDKISFIGASIGANLSLQYISGHQEFKTAVLLSPGLNYRGIKTEPLVKNLKSDQKVFFVSAEDDDDNAEQVQKLYDSIPAGVEKKIQIYETGGHGTDILENHPELKELIINFIK